MGPQTSIIVPNLDSPLVGATIAALQNQNADTSSCEIIVVGRDRPGLVPRDGSVVWIETDAPLGPGAARNLGVGRSDGLNILFTDSDCRPDSDWIGRISLALDHSPVVGGSARFDLSGNNWAVADNIASFHDLLEDRPPGIAGNKPVGSLNLGVTRDAWNRVGPFDESLVTSEDYDWYLRAKNADLEVYFEPTAVVEHAAVRTNRHELEAHASWYGRHFLQFCEKNPGVFGQGPTWSSRQALAMARPLKAFVSALQIYQRHRVLRSAWRAFPGVGTFKLAWYKAIVDSWQES